MGHLACHENDDLRWKENRHKELNVEQQKGSIGIQFLGLWVGITITDTSRCSKFDFQLEVDHNERCSPSGVRSNTVVIGHTQQSRARAPGGRSRRQLMAANSRAGIDGARGALATPPAQPHTGN